MSVKAIFLLPLCEITFAEFILRESLRSMLLPRTIAFPSGDNCVSFCLCVIALIKDNLTATGGLLTLSSLFRARLVLGRRFWKSSPFPIYPRPEYYLIPYFFMQFSTHDRVPDIQPPLIRLYVFSKWRPLSKTLTSFFAVTGWLLYW